MVCYVIIEHPNVQIEEVNMHAHSPQGTAETHKYYMQALFVPPPHRSLSLSLHVQCARRLYLRTTVCQLLQMSAN